VGRSHFHPSFCKDCGATNEETHISQTGLCFGCGLERRLANNEQLENGSGPFYEHWLRRSYLAMRPRLLALDASQRSPREVESEA